MGTSEVALELIRRAKTAGQVQAALEAAPPGPTLRRAIIERYDQLAANPRQDPGAQVRAALMRALKPLVTTADRDRVEKAVLIKEFGFGPQGENCAGLRGAALLALGELEPELAEVYAVRLLTDEHTEEMSGEPALTAVRFLAARESVAAIYLFALSGRARQEILAEALRSLAALPAGLVVQLAESMRSSEDDVALVGLFDLLTAHPEPAAFEGFVHDWALKTRRLEVLQFASAQAVASRKEPLVKALREAAAQTAEERRRAILSEALAAAPPAGRAPAARSRPGSA